MTQFIVFFCFFLQINFFKDHTKIIVCPLMGAATYIDEGKRFRTFPLKNIEKHGCCRSLASRLHYARKMIDQIQENEKKGKKEWPMSSIFVDGTCENLSFNTSRFNSWRKLRLSYFSQLALWVEFLPLNDGFCLLLNYLFAEL